MKAREEDNDYHGQLAHTALAGVQSIPSSAMPSLFLLFLALQLC